MEVTLTSTKEIEVSISFVGFKGRKEGVNVEKENNKSIKFIIMIILLIIIILILLFFARFGEIDNKNMLIPTGNVDVFDIYIRCACTDKDNCITKNTDGNEILAPVFNEEEDKDKLGNVFVYDKNGDYVYQQRLRIFENAAYQYTNKIAPGVSNTYHFVVHNSNDFKLKYYIEMYEEEDYGVNLRYRLRKNNEYVIGDDNTWVTASELETALDNIGVGSSDSYALDWSWPYESGNDELDSYIGENMDKEYKLNVRFYFEEAV